MDKLNIKYLTLKCASECRSLYIYVLKFSTYFPNIIAKVV